MTPIRILVVDDHPIVRDGIVGVFAGDDGFDVIGVARDGLELLEQLQSAKPDVILLDLRMPRMGGVAAIRRIRESGCPVRIVVLTTFDSDDDVLPAIEAGADGYLLKDTSGVELKHAVREAHGGRPVIVSEVAAALMRRASRPRPVRLSDRELEVLRLVAGGATNREAGDALFISETTVKTHLMHLFEKLGVNDRAAAVHEAHRRGML
ncbi:response regulator transcription factor [Blastococcus sp. Marseille-P5729]|uniref:response regulator n=1 Tax=Blastococcus sp. Marseille-P5729 TaxID=2086582 RepID=UPI000D0E8B51|nr:response regulator transcription factor [Blastococcus sp. Marseille-P5729]